MTLPDDSVTDLIEKHPGLREVGRCLSDLVRTNPRLVTPILELAMVYGIHAGVTRAHTEAKLAVIREQMEAAASAPFQWSGIAK